MTDLERSIRGLETLMPEMSARRTLTRGQLLIAACLAILLVGGLLANALATLVGANLVVTAIFLGVLLYKLHLARHALRRTPLVVVSDEEARAIPDRELPIYSVLMAAYRESEVIADTIRALERLDYPADRLEIMVLLESDDSATIQAARAAEAAGNVQIVLVPGSHPRTKPKACNYGLTQARGDVVTIYDAEDRPEPLQLRRAVAAFRKLGPEVVCLQAKLAYHNATQNLITRLFAIEYLTWFQMLLPALAARGGPVPLGGTSMHIIRPVLDRVGGWDPYNVTEDADLGVRLQRLGYQTEVLDSTTYEEANSDFINWMKQRSRWYKGYLQTWLVHMRHPVRLRRELGTEPFISFSLTVGATPLVALVNPIFWVLTLLWFGLKVHFVQALFPPSVYYAGLLCMVLGNFTLAYLSAVAIRSTGHSHLLGAVLLSPIYWAMMSVAALKAFVQLVSAPHFWEKTTHGLDKARDAAPVSAFSPPPTRLRAAPGEVST